MIDKKSGNIFFLLILIALTTGVGPVSASFGDACSDGGSGLESSLGNCITFDEIGDAALFCEGSVDGYMHLGLELEDGNCYLATPDNVFIPGQPWLGAVAGAEARNSACDENQFWAITGVEGDVLCPILDEELLIDYYIKNGSLPSVYTNNPPTLERPDVPQNGYSCVWTDDGCKAEGGDRLRCEDGYYADQEACGDIDIANECNNYVAQCIDSRGLPTEPEPEKVSLGLASATDKFYTYAIGLGVLIATALIIYGGFLYTISGGSSNMTAKAKTTITRAFIGLLILLAIPLIFSLFNPDLNTLDEILLGVNKEARGLGIDTVLGGLGEATDGDQCLPPGSTNYVPSAQTCPFVVEPGFTNSWCQFRAQTKVHLGTDMFPLDNSPPAPLVAIEDGVILEENCDEAAGDAWNKPGTSIAGVRLYLWGNASGNNYFYAHMNDCNVVKGQTVTKGQLLGHVGDTGNARGTPPHLHIGIRVNGSQSNHLAGDYANPYNLMRSLCRYQDLPQEYCRENCDATQWGDWFCASFPVCEYEPAEVQVGQGGVLACPSDDHSRWPSPITSYTEGAEEYIKHIQRDLVYVTASSLDITGELDLDTTRAIRAYRDSKNLSLSGGIDGAFLNSLEADVTAECSSGRQPQ